MDASYKIIVTVKNSEKSLSTGFITETQSEIILRKFLNLMYKANMITDFAIKEVKE